MLRREKRKKSRPVSEYFKRDYLRRMWKKHWEIIVTAIAALIIGILFIPMIMR
jgi:hypothetical protein